MSFTQANPRQPMLSDDAKALAHVYFMKDKRLEIRALSMLSERARKAFQELVIHGRLRYSVIGSNSGVYERTADISDCSAWAMRNPKKCGWPIYDV